ncbi:MAG TPA: tetratricopeptide repeat protein [Myxococcota bacterium]|nr:tetratricopeptide repeat protein [Myxococcota bacterium]
MATLASAMVCLLLALGGCAPGIDPIPKEEAPTTADTARFVRLRVEEARAFRLQNRLDAAAQSLERALAVAPNDPEALRLLARVLSESGHEEQAPALRARADRVDPPPSPPPDEPLEFPGEGVLVVLLPPEPEDPTTTGLFDEWPDRRAPDVLVAQLRKRLPHAAVTELSPATVAEARAWLRSRSPRAVLSLRVDRANCGDSAKDGPFALAVLTVSAGTPERLSVLPRSMRVVDGDPQAGKGCADEALSRALERVFADQAVRATLASGTEPATAALWPSPEIRALFPGLGRRLASEIDRGRARLAVGRLNDAEESFRRAEAIDPDDKDVRVYIEEARATLALARELEPTLPPARAAALGGDLIEVELSPAQRAGAEQMLSEERARRDALLAAISLVGGEGDELSPAIESALRPAEIARGDAPGPRLAAQQAHGPVAKRVLFAPDGRTLAVFYVPTAGGPPVLREDGADGAPERWTAYAGRRRSEVWEDREHAGVPTSHFVLGRDGTVQKIEVLRAADGTPVRVFEYAGGRLVSEAQDTNGDGILDRFERFDADGEVVLREEDLNGDGKIDVRSFFEKGKLVRREITDPELLQGAAPREGGTPVP